MKNFFKYILLTAAALTFSAAAVFAGPYPATLDEGNLVLVDAGMGVGKYADRASVAVEMYAPPDYQLAIRIVPVVFSEEYWRVHRDYLGSPYTIKEPFSLRFRYNWDRKVMAYERGGHWQDWDVNRDYCHAEGDPLIPRAAEVAFVSAYNTRFFGDKTGYSPVLKRERRVIDEGLYRALGL